MSRIDPKVTCGTCMWWHEGANVLGECRLTGPHHTDGGQNGYWPLVHREAWCSHHKELPFDHPERKKARSLP